MLVAPTPLLSSRSHSLPRQQDRLLRRSPTHTAHSPSASPYPQPLRSHSTPYFPQVPSPQPRLSPRPNSIPTQQPISQSRKPHHSDSAPTVSQHPGLYYPDYSDIEGWPINFKAHPSIEYKGYRRYNPDAYAYGQWEDGSEETSKSTAIFDIPNVSFY